VSEATSQIWNLSNGSPVTTLSGHTQRRIEGAMFFQDDLVATVGDETVRFWDASSGSTLTVSRTHAIAIASAAFRPDSHEIATAAYDRTIVLQSVQPRRLELEQLQKITRCLPFKLEAGRLVAAPGC
jgi:WD40 repeat protein